MRPSKLIRRFVVWVTIGVFILFLIAGHSSVAGGVLGVGFVVWFLMLVFAWPIDALTFAWLRRRSRATASQQVARRIERATTGTGPSPTAKDDEDDEIELSPANVDAEWRDGDAWRTWEAPRNLVAGESHYMSALHELTGDPRQGGYLIPAEVVFIREPANAYDANAWRAEVDLRHVGYAARHIAAQLARGLDPLHVTTFTVCGVIRGGSLEAPNIGVHVWPSRRPCPGPDLRQVDDALGVPWPPSLGEGEVRPAADMFDVYLQRGRETIAAGGPEDRAFEALKAAADVALANDEADQKEAAAALAERLMGYARGTQTLARAARLKKRLEPKARSTKQAGAAAEERLTRLKDLLDRGVITDDEYTAQRASIIKQL